MSHSGGQLTAYSRFERVSVSCGLMLYFRTVMLHAVGGWEECEQTVGCVRSRNLSTETSRDQTATRKKARSVNVNEMLGL